MDEVYAGWHVTYDAFVSPKASGRLWDHEFVKRSLKKFAKFLGAQIIVPPTFGEHTIDDEVVSCLCLLTVGHVVLHARPLQHRFHFDAFWTGKIDQYKTLEWLRDHFHVEKRSASWIVRAWP